MSDRPLLTKGELVAQREARKALRSNKTPLKAVNKERVAKKAESEGYDPDYLGWIRKQPCIITGKRTGELHLDQYQQPQPTRVEAAHMVAGKTKGTDMTALPVHWWYHTTGPESQHKMGIKSWAKHHNLDIPALIAAHRKRYSLEMAERSRQER